MRRLEPSPVALGARWARSVPLTLAFCSLLAFVYGVELLVLRVAGVRALSYWFVATAEPSPGWVLAALAHTPGRPSHLLSSAALLLAFGGMTERRLPGRAYLTFLSVAGLGGTAGQVLWYAAAPSPVPVRGTLGASAVGLAATTFAAAASARTRLATGEWTGETTWVWALLGAFVAGRRLVLDLVVGVAGVGRFGHLWGILFGVAYALWHRVGERESSRRDR
ncbi:MAG: rhomboid family intramembrane serine protease [Halorientalis sp.]